MRRVAAAGAFALLALIAAHSQDQKVKELAPGVFFWQGETETRRPANCTWIIFNDYVLVIDANFPSGANVIIPKIKALTDKPIRFTFDTHHHGDHAYGNQVWLENGATPVAHEGVLAEMKKYDFYTRFGHGEMKKFVEDYAVSFHKTAAATAAATGAKQ